MLPSTFERLLVLYARHFPMRYGKLRVINRLWRAAAGDGCTYRLATLKHGRFRMACDISQMLQRQFYFFGTYFLEEGILACWQTAAKGAKVVLDVGANAGIYSLAALAIQPDAAVHAFEPTPEIAAQLRATANLNELHHLNVHEVAVFSKNGRVTLKRFRGELGTNEGMNYISQDIGDSTAEVVKTVTIDEFCKNHSIDYIDLLKLDIQGHEYSALSGARQLIKAGRVGSVFMELNWARGAGVPCVATESIRLLEKAGYRFSKPNKHLKWEKAGDWLRTLNDVVAHRETA